MKLIPRKVEVYDFPAFVGRKAIRFEWLGWQYAYGILRRGDPLDGPFGGTRHPRWLGGWSWRTKRGIVARCKYRVAKYSAITRFIRWARR